MLTSVILLPASRIIITMSYCVNVKDVKGKEIANGVTERILLKPENTGASLSGDLTVKHYILEKDEVLELKNDNVERQDYVIMGSVFFGGRYLHGNTTILPPSGAKVKYT